MQKKIKNGQIGPLTVTKKFRELHSFSKFLLRIFIKGKKSNKDSLHAKPVACDSCMEQSSRKVKQQRNQQRKQEYHSGISMQCLTKKCNLSLYAVRKIIYQK